jgi:hypothetical protein
MTTGWLYRLVFKRFSAGKTQNQPYALPHPHRFCIFGGLLFRRRNPTPVCRKLDPDPASTGQGSQGLLPMGNGQAPGIEIGRGVRGAATGAAVRATGCGAGRFSGMADFFLAAFFLADFSVGFFLLCACGALLRAAVFARAGLRGAVFFLATAFFFAAVFFFSGALFFTGARRETFLRATAFLTAFFAALRFFAFAMSIS